jgi:hypothetical protein
MLKRPANSKISPPMRHFQPSSIHSLLVTSKQADILCRACDIERLAAMAEH